MPISPGPGAPPFPEDLRARLSAAVERRLAREPARTRHLDAAGAPRFANRLALETSPYLLQHAHNPVDWRPWGAEAFDEARRLARPVFLSVGYSTCHWCHVMEEESFEDEEIARLLNEKYVPVKVDREERPDLDAQYMQAVQLLTHQGGWPMSLFLLPDGQPVYGGTYFPPRDGDRGAQVGFRTVLLELDRLWREERERLSTSAAHLSALVRESLAPEPSRELPDEGALRSALAIYAQNFDAREGGLRRAPKFPSSLHARFLLRAARRFGDEQARHMALFSLEKMALGGLFDQVGAGFHRYSTDARWLVPHFEKMLYDNALLAMAYVEGWQVSARPFFRRIARETLGWMDAEMSDPGGGFWSAQDADSLTPAGHREEGAFFAWTPAQLAEALGPADGARAAQLLGATEGGNFEGANVLSLAAVPSDEEQAFLDRVRPVLGRVRATRPPPLIDRKVLAAWNGLAISAFARAGFAFGDDALVRRAARAADFLLRVHLRDGVLLRASLEGEARHGGVLEDYAFLAAGLVDLFEATGERRWLDAARALHDALEARFADPAGGYFRAPEGAEALLGREKPGYDGAEPTGNSVAALTLLRLGELTGEARFGAAADGILRAFAGTLAGTPHALAELLLALDFRLGTPRAVVLVRPAGGNDGELLDVLRGRFLPHDVRVRHEEGAQPATPLARERPAANGRATAYVCAQGACRLPVDTAAALAAQL